MNQNYYDILKKLRVFRGVTQKQLGNGLCSVSQLSLIESGDRNPSYSLRIRFLKRLGFYSVKQVNYFQPDEYEILNKQIEIFEALKSNQLEEVKRLIGDITDTITDEYAIINQFVCDINGIIFLKNAEYENAYYEYEKAVSLSMKNITAENLGEYAIAPIEYYYLLMRNKCEEYISGCNKDSINKTYLNIIDHIERAFIEEGARAEIYPYAVVEYIDFIEKNLEYNTSTIEQLVEKAFSLLRKSSRTFCLKRIIEIRKKYLIAKFNDEEIANNEKWLDAINSLYELVDFKDDELFSYHFYSDINYQSISDIIQGRRKLYKMTQAELADGICSVKKTLRRLEQGKVTCQKEIVRDLLSKLGVCSSYKDEELSTDDWGVAQLAQEYRKCIYSKELDKAEIILEKMKDYFDPEIPSNYQLYLRNKAILQRVKNEISVEQYILKLEEAMYQTVENQYVYEYTEGYLTEGELNCLYSIAIATNKEDSVKIERIRSIFEKVTENEKSMFPAFKAMVYRWIEQNYADVENFLMADKYALKTIETELNAYKVHMSYFAYYDMTWNAARTNQQNVDFVKKLETSYYLAELFNDRAIAAFLKEKITLCKNNIFSWVD